MDRVSGSAIWRRSAGVVTNLLLAGGYALLGFGCATTGLHEQIIPLWLPAGLALAAVLRFGRGMLPGVWLGSFLVDLILPGNGGSPQPEALLAALVIASGATVQTGLGAYLIRRLGVDPLAPASERWMLGFLLSAGVLTCTLNASLGTLALTYISQSQGSLGLPLDWFRWWLGDSFGAVFGTPLFLSLLPADRPGSVERRWLLPLQLLVTLVVLLVINQHYLSHLSRLLERGFRQDVQLVDAHIQAIIQQNLRDLTELERQIAAHPELSAAHFRQLVAAHVQGNPAVRAYSWDPLVPRAQKEAFEQRTRRLLGDPAYTIRGDSPPIEEALIPVQFVEPLEQNRAALGVNLYSLEDRRRWVHEAQARGQAVATGILQLTQAPDEPGLLILQPVYRQLGGGLLHSRRELLGFVVGVFTVARFFDAALAQSGIGHLQLSVSEPSADPFYSTITVATDQVRLRQSFPVRLGQQVWRVEAVAGPDYLASHPFSQVLYFQVLLLGGGTLAALLILSMYNRERSLVARVRQQTLDLAWQARHDDLTELPNRTRMQELLVQWLNTPGSTFALLFIDLDRFKLINDSLGHQVGDHLLQALAHQMRLETPAECELFRMGGDEFILLVPGTAERASREAERILRVVSRTYRVDEYTLQLTASIGISLHPAHGRDADSLIKHADTAMYRAKSRGKDRYEFYCAQLTSDAMRSFSLEQDLRRALQEHQLVLHYQPQYRLDDQCLCGLEALVRWQHPQRGLLGPDKFIPLAEETQLIVPLGWQVIEQACQQVARWLEQGLEVPLVAVNISPHQLLQADFITRLNEMVDGVGLEREQLELEITESMIQQDPDFVIEQLRRLRRAGYHLALDDFGTGFSSLDRLKYLPLNRLKIDKSFTRDIGRNPKDEAVILTVIALGRSLGVEVLAEGVETEQQLEFLKHHHCDSMQGFLKSKPVAAKQISLPPRRSRTKERAS
ncbi:MAG: EAL domain-containing protein [Pseudomonadota bacterium]|nr:EAL domain-containing protein [Pseudomonadota bacterium]